MTNRMGNAGISVAVHTPLVAGGDYLYTVTDLSTYGHTISAVGGYASADISFAVDLVALQDWYDKGLMRHIVCNDVAGNIFEGFVNEITLNYGARQLTIGPAKDIANRIAVVYTPVFDDSTTSPRVTGGQTITRTAENLVSQARYGIFSKLIDGGECTDTEAELVRDAYIKDMAYPPKNETLNTEDTGTLKVSLKIIGYSDLLTFIPESSTTIAKMSYTNFIAALVAYDPNSYFSTSTEYMAVNPTIATSFPDGTKSIMDLIKAVCALGDASNNRWTFGVYEGRKVYYQPVPTSVKYVYRLSEGIKSLSIYPGPNVVRPWNIRPAFWLKYTDFPLTTSLISDGLVADPQAVFIESIAYKAPYGLTINGGRVSTLAQQLARLGLGTL